MICLESMKKSCGCDLLKKCDCVLKPFEVTYKELQKMTKWQLFCLYTRCINDEMSPIMFKGFTKKQILDMILDGSDRKTLTPFY